jgi:hypothetical protein
MESSGPTVSVIQPNPCADRHSMEQINIINQNVSGIGNQVNALASAMADFLNKQK